jgi:hypothetical protein
VRICAPWLHSHRIYRYLRLLDSIATSDEKSTYLAREKLRGRRKESFVEAREDRQLRLSPDERSEEELLQVRVGGGK